MAHNRTILVEKVKESLRSVLPITLIVLVLSFTIAPIPTSTLLAFIIGAILLVVGMGFFTLGAEMAMSPMGESIGSHITSSRKLWLIISVALVLGIVITVSEPDLQVLAEQVPQIDRTVLIGAVSIGVGIFLVISLLRILFNIRLSYMLFVFYGIVFIMAIFVKPEFIAIAFDSGGVTTGPMTVPLIMAFGVGVSSIRSDSRAESDSFGLVALCSIGPIMAVMILGIVYRTGDVSYVNEGIPLVDSSRDLWSLFTNDFPTYFAEVAVALAPIVIFFAIFQVVSLRIQKRPMLRIIVGIFYTYFGLVFFLTGVNVGFMPAGNYLGQVIAGLEHNWLLIPIGMIIGYFIVAAEPAVYVLNKQVEESTSGAIPPKALSRSLSIGVAVSLGLAMIRVMTGISILWFIIPGYIIALVLTVFVPPLFTSIAFDSGGVASGPMATTFLLPFAIGACSALGGNVVTDAFGAVAMVAMTPLITIQVLGLVYKHKLAKAPETVEDIADEDEIIEL